ncbi:MAG: ATP-binding protein [Vicinamibacterales bacterium]
MSELNVTLVNRLDEIGRLATLIEGYGATQLLSPEVVYAFNLSLDEVLTNVISYAFADAREHTINVRLSITNGQLQAEVADTGRPFNPLDVPPPNLDAPIEQRPIGGLGLHIVREMMDRLEYRRVDERNVLTLTRRIG